MRLYALEHHNESEGNTERVVLEQKISPWRLSVKGEALGFKAKLGRLVFWLLSKGHFRVFYVTAPETSRVIHTSYVMGRSFKFPFMKKGDIHIGPCQTDPEQRGKGIYKAVLRHITRQTVHKTAYMIVAESNLPSIKGIEGVGFCHIGTVERSRFLKVYRRSKHGNMENI